MATFTLSCVSSSGGSNASSYFKQNSTMRVTYTASNGTLKITEIEGTRNDSYRTSDSNAKTVSISIGGTSKSVSLSHYVDFGTYNSYTAWGATDTSWTGLSGSSISVTITLPSTTTAFDSTKFTGTATMSWSKYTVSYNANGGTGAPDPQTKTHGTALTLSSVKPTRTGYTFVGWGSSASATTAINQPGGTYTGNDDYEYFAIWTENVLTVNYYSNYADYGTYQGKALSVSSSSNVLVDTQKYYYDNSYENGLSNVQNSEYLYLSRTGYTPTGFWGTSTSGGTLVSQSLSFSTGQALAQALGKNISNGNATVAVYAQWQKNTYKIEYYANGGYGSMNSQTVEWQETFSLLANTFKREGYKFAGWNLYRNADNKWYVSKHGWLTENEIITNGYSKQLYLDERTLTFEESWIKENEDARLFTLYATWEISGVVYIDNGMTFEPYLVYIDNGSGWDLYLAYIDNGTEWKIIS